MAFRQVPRPRCVQGLQPCGRRSIRFNASVSGGPVNVVCWRRLPGFGVHRQQGVDGLDLDSVPGPSMRFLWAFGTFWDRVGVVEGGYLDSRTLGDAGMHWPGFFDLQSWLKA